jgi:signal transduction histidine kinase
MDRRLASWRRISKDDPLLADGALAGLLAALTLFELATNLHCPCVTAADAWWTGIFMLTQTIPLTFRRRYPFAVFLMVSVSAIVYDVLHIPPDPYTAIFAILVAVYSVSAYARRRLAIVAGIIAATALIVVNLPPIAGDQDFGDLVNQFALLGGAWIVGENARRRRREADLLRDRAERAERERSERERIAVLEERNRLAREIHDVIAHSVSVIAVQAGTARAIAEERPDRAREALASIERVSKQTMVELRAALGALGPSDVDAPLSPSPGIGSIPNLVDRVRAAGLSVTFTEAGARPELPRGIDLAGYRIVQEALTNAVKYGDGRSDVVLRYEPDVLDVVVSNDIAASTDHPEVRDGLASGGHGLLGLRERVAMFGGAFEAGDRNGRFVVHARLPLAIRRGSA